MQLLPLPSAAPASVLKHASPRSAASVVRVLDPPQMHRPPADPTAAELAATRDAGDRELVSRIHDGDEGAFAALFDEYVVPLCIFVLSYVQSRETAADVVHDVFLRIWQRRDELEIRDSVKAYLYRATRNRALNLIRRETLEQRWKDEAALESAAAPASSVLPVDESMDRDTLVAAVERVAAELPERCRMVFLLRWRDGLRHGEIAEVMGISPKTVENQMTRALRTLRERLAPFFD